MSEAESLEQPGGSALPWLLAGIFGLVIALGSPPLTIPDSLELMAEGGCMVGLEYWAQTCADLNPAYWTPGWSLPVGVLSIFLSPLAASGAVSLLSMSLLVVPCWSIGRRLGGSWAGGAAAILVMCTPALQTYGMLADGRGLALLCLFGSWALALRSLESDRVLRWGALAGAVAGLGVLVRPEGLLTLALLPLFLGAWSRSWRLAGAALAGGASLALPWWIVLSAHRGQLSLTPRDWEATGFPLLELLPKRQVLELYGMGAQDTPFRELALESQARVSGTGIDLVGGIGWLGEHLPEALPIWGLMGAIAGLVLGVRRRRLAPVCALLLAGLPSLIAAFKPQSRDVLLPMANFLPIVVCSWVLCGMAVAASGVWIVRRWRLPALSPVLPIAAAAGPVALAGPAVDLAPGTELLEPGREASAWLRAQEDVRVRASFESAPVVHLGEQRWDPWPSRWDPEAWTDATRRPDFVLLTDLDDYFRPGEGPPMTPVAYFGDDRSWVLLLELDSP